MTHVTLCVLYLCRAEIRLDVVEGSLDCPLGESLDQNTGVTAQQVTDIRHLWKELSVTI